jgi:hypothetical protein
MRRVANILGLLLVLGWSLAAPVAAQVSNGNGPITPEKLDEFGSVGHCDLGARLDNYAISFQGTKGATLQIVVYGPPGEGIGAGKQLLSLISGYLTDARGIDPERIKTVYAGRNSDLLEPRIQLWIVPENTVPPEPEKLENNNVATFKGMFFERPVYDTLNFWYDLEDGMGPGIGRSIHASFADMLEHQKNSVAYIVAYNGEESFPGAWRRIAEAEVGYFKKLNVDPGRFKIIFGGRQAEAKLQVWLLPKDAPPPVRDAGRELPPKKAFDAASLGADELGNKEYEARAYKTLVSILQADKSTRAFLVVRLDAPSPKDGEATELEKTTEPLVSVEDEDEEPVTEKTEPADLTKLIEKWRLDLTTTHKIRNDRIIIIFLPGSETASNSINLWLVPKGQPLPDPNEEDEEGEEDPKPPGK